MKRLPLFIFLFSVLISYSQLKDIKIIIPKEISYSYYDFVAFFPDEKYFVVCANSLSVFNTETSEIIDDAELPYLAKSLSISSDGKYISVCANNELLVFSFINQKLELFFKTTTSELIKGMPQSEYYGSLPIGGCFFTSNPNEIYVSIGSFTLLYDLQKKVTTKSHTFPVADYIMQTCYSPKTQEIILAKTSGTVSSIVKQSLNNLSEVKEVISSPSTIAKIRLRDSLLFCFTAANYFILNLENNNIVHEVRMMKYDYSYMDKATLKLANNRPAISKPDTINFSSDEYIYDIDYSSATGCAVYSGMKGLKYIDLKTKKLKEIYKNSFVNFRFSNSGKRMVANGYYPYKALRVYNPVGMKLISERPSMGNVISSTDISPNKRWMYTNGTNSGFLWDLNNFSKYAELKDISGSDSSFIYGVLFLNDSEMVVNSGKSFQHLNLSIYNLHKKKYIKTLKKNVYSFISGFSNGEFFYSDYKSLTILNLKTLTEEKYDGMFSFAASNPSGIINFTKDLIFIPDAAKYKIVNRKTKKTEYESSSWSVTANVIISPDNKFVYTASQINKKQKINGYEVDMPVNAIVKIDMTKKEIAKDFAVTYFPYDFKLKDNGKKICIWYLKQDYTNTSGDKEVTYTEYDTESGQELFSKSIAKTKDMIASHATSETGKYFSLFDPYGKYFKVFNERAEEVINLSEINLAVPKCFFIESLDRLIITNPFTAVATFVDLKKRKIIGQLANANNDNFFLITSDLYYLGSKEFVKNMRFKYQSEIFSFEQFDAYLNQPHNVLRAFGCPDSNFIHAYETAYLKRMKVLGLKPGSKINFSALPIIQSVQMQEGKPGFTNFSLSANKGQNKLSKLDVYNNGTLVFSELISADQNSRYDKNLSFETSSGINRFEFMVKDELGLESPHITRFFNNTSNVKQNLFLVVIASEKFKNNKFDLAYAVKDASDMANTMANSKSFNKIEIKKLFNQSFTPDSVKALSNFFSKASVNDVVMVFFAGHGYLDDDLSYYFPTYYTDFSDPKINSVAYKNFEGLFKEMKPLRKLMFIDACFSGEVDEDIYETEDENKSKKDERNVRLGGSTFAQSTAMEMSKAIFSDLRQNSGATIISSAGGTEAAYEGEKWNNGLFTHCVIDGLKSLKADQNMDKKITLSELQKYVAEEVNRLSDGKQTPTYRMENTVLDYELW